MAKTITGTAAVSMELYDFLRSSMHLTKRQIRQAKFRERGICVNGEQKRVTYRLSPKDVVEVRLEREAVPSPGLAPSDRPVEILYEDGDLCIVNKPAGVLTHPCGGREEDSMAGRLLAHFCVEGEPLRIRLAGRLDRETSGVLVFAKSQAAAGRLARQRERKIFRKEYLALAAGPFRGPEGVIALPLAADPSGRRVVSPDGKPAVTRYRVLREYADSTLLQITLDTGRTHQIRAHLAALGHPLLGDVLYGGSRERIARTALHARRVTLRQPFGGEKIEAEAPLPADLRELLAGYSEGSA